MLKLRGLGKLAINFSPTGLSVGTRQIHYAWVIVAIATTMLVVTSSVRFAAAALPRLGVRVELCCHQLCLQPPVACVRNR